jgi:hypothetical protein
MILFLCPEQAPEGAAVPEIGITDYQESDTITIQSTLFQSERPAEAEEFFCSVETLKHYSNYNFYILGEDTKETRSILFERNHASYFF